MSAREYAWASECDRSVHANLEDAVNATARAFGVGALQFTGITMLFKDGELQTIKLTFARQTFTIERVWRPTT